jgi:FKBP-type peptidyl-prolyl cis-trans isomerase FklB
MKMHMVFVLILLILIMAPAFTVAGTNEEGLAYLEDNKAKEGVVVLPSGLQYKILQKGSGAHHPTVSSPCLCHYEGKLISGDVFDSSYERGSPTTFAPNQVIKGWTEIMQLMVEGDKFVSCITSSVENIGCGLLT